MPTADALRNEIAHHIQDPAFQAVNAAQILAFINAAAQDASNEGWLKDTEDTSLTLSASTYEYTVPSGLAYIHAIWQEATADAGTYPNFIPWHKWELNYNGSNSVISFSRDSFTVTASIDLLIKGQTRPTTSYTASDTIDTGMESFIRERAIVYAARFLAAQGGTRAQWYAQLAQTAMASSEALLQQQGEFFRPKRYSRAVPLR